MSTCFSKLSIQYNNKSNSSKPNASYTSQEEGRGCTLFQFTTFRGIKQISYSHWGKSRRQDGPQHFHSPMPNAVYWSAIWRRLRKKSVETIVIRTRCQISSASWHQVINLICTVHLFKLITFADDVVFFKQTLCIQNCKVTDDSYSFF